MKNGKSNRKLKEQISRKTNPILLETLMSAKKNKGWKKIADILSSSTKKQSRLNLFEIDANTSAGDTVLIPGKVLSEGEITKKIKICALSASKNAREKIKHSKTEFLTINEEINKNPKCEGIKILRRQDALIDKNSSHLGRAQERRSKLNSGERS